MWPGGREFHLQFPLMSRGANQMPEFRFEPKLENQLRTNLQSGVNLWLCLHLSPELCIRSHLPAALWLILRHSLISTNEMDLGNCEPTFNEPLSATENPMACSLTKLEIGF